MSITPDRHRVVQLEEDCLGMQAAYRRIKWLIEMVALESEIRGRGRPLTIEEARECRKYARAVADGETMPCPTKSPTT